MLTSLATLAEHKLQCIILIRSVPHSSDQSSPPSPTSMPPFTLPDFATSSSSSSSLSLSHSTFQTNHFYNIHTYTNIHINYTTLPLHYHFSSSLQCHHLFSSSLFFHFFCASLHFLLPYNTKGKSCFPTPAVKHAGTSMFLFLSMSTLLVSQFPVPSISPAQIHLPFSSELAQ